MIFYVVIRKYYDVEYGSEYNEFYAVRTNKQIADQLAAAAQEKSFRDGYDFIFEVQEHTEESIAKLEIQ